MSVQERSKVFKNIQEVVEILTPESRANSIYISKFLAAAAAGLFDASLNYLWDETVLELRKRVSLYDISYFYDQAIYSDDRRKKFKDESDLSKLDDSELIEGARQIDLISELGYKHLDFIKYMRNWASAAHPNQNELTGLQLVSWLETCIKEVISLPLSTVAIEIKKLLINIKKSAITKEYAESIVPFFVDLPVERAGTLLAVFLDCTIIPTQPLQRSTTSTFLPQDSGPLLRMKRRKQSGLSMRSTRRTQTLQKRRQPESFLIWLGGFHSFPTSSRLLRLTPR